MKAEAMWEIVTSLVDSLAWPLIALTALVMLRPSIRGVISRISKVKHGVTEVKFGKKDSDDLEAITVSKPVNRLDTQTSASSMPKFYGYLNYKGGTSNFWAFGIRTGDKLNVTAYPFRELSNEPCYFSLSGGPDPGEAQTVSGTTIEHLVQVGLAGYSKNNPYRTTLTIPNYASLTNPPCEAEITNLEIDSEGPVAFILDVIEQKTH